LIFSKVSAACQCFYENQKLGKVPGASLTWRLPDPPRATLHVLAGEGFGAYCYKAVTLSTDTKPIVFTGRAIDDSAQCGFPVSAS